jgi:hypothetical protein
MLGQGRVAMRDFELLKVLGTGGECNFSFFFLCLHAS